MPKTRCTLLSLLATLAFAGCGAAETEATHSEDGREDNPMMVIRVLLEVQPDQTDAFVAHLREEAIEVRALDGCERFELFVDPSSPHRFLLYEEWASEQAFQAYQDSDLLRESFAVLGPMMAGPPDSSYFQASLRPH